MTTGGSPCSFRAHLDVHAMLSQLRQTRGRPSFRVAAARGPSIDGCFSKVTADRQPFVDAAPFRTSLRSPSAQALTRTSNSRSASRLSRESGITGRTHDHPFRSSSNNPGVPERQWSYHPSRSTSRTRDPPVPSEAEVLTHREVNSSAHRSGRMMTQHEASVQRIVRLRYQDVTKAGERKFPKLFAQPAKSAPVEPVRSAIDPGLAWLYVKPEHYCAGTIPPASLHSVVAFMGPQSSHTLAIASQCCATAVHAAFPPPRAVPPVTGRLHDTLGSIPQGYFEALGLVEESEGETLQWTTLSMMAILLVLAGEATTDVIQVVRTPIDVPNLVGLWRKHFQPGSWIDPTSMVTPHRILECADRIVVLLDHLYGGRAPHEIRDVSEVEDSNASKVVQAVMSAVEWNTESF